MDNKIPYGIGRVNVSYPHSNLPQLPQVHPRVLFKPFEHVVVMGQFTFPQLL